MNSEFYAVPEMYQNSLTHFGRKGMKWGEHIFGTDEIKSRLSSWMNGGLYSQQPSTLLNQNRRTQISDQVSSWLGRAKSSTKAFGVNVSSKSSEYAKKGKLKVEQYSDEFLTATLNSLPTKLRLKGFSIYDKLLKKKCENIYYDDTSAISTIGLTYKAGPRSTVSNSQHMQNKIDQMMSVAGGKRANEFRNLTYQHNDLIRKSNIKAYDKKLDSLFNETQRRSDAQLRGYIDEQMTDLKSGRYSERVTSQLKSALTSYSGMQTVKQYVTSNFGNMTYEAVFGKLSNPKYQSTIQTGKDWYDLTFKEEDWESKRIMTGASGFG